MLYSKSTGGFYAPEINGDDIPGDAKFVTQDAYVALMQAQSAGKVIAGDENGMPVVVEPPKFGDAEVNRLREAAYRAEADPIFFKYQRGEASKDDWMSVVNDIRTRYPKP